MNTIQNTRVLMVCWRCLKLSFIDKNLPKTCYAIKRNIEKCYILRTIKEKKVVNTGFILLFTNTCTWQLPGYFMAGRLREWRKGLDHVYNSFKQSWVLMFFSAKIFRIAHNLSLILQQAIVTFIWLCFTARLSVVVVFNWHACLKIKCSTWVCRPPLKMQS